MHDGPEMNSDFQFDAMLARDVVIAFRKRPLDFSAHCTASSAASELEQERVADGFNLGAMEARQHLAHDATMGALERGLRLVAPSRCNRPCR